MALTNSTHQWGSVAKFFHWLIALLVIGMLLIGASLDLFPQDIKSNVVQLHKATGLTVCALMLLRLFWRFINPRPLFPETMAHWQLIAAKWSHVLLYTLIIAMPISGFIMSTAGGHVTSYFGLVALKAPGIPENEALKDIANEIHTLLGWSIFILLLIHISAAMKHHFWDKDNVYINMLPRGLGEKMDQLRKFK